MEREGGKPRWPRMAPGVSGWQSRAEHVRRSHLPHKAEAPGPQAQQYMGKVPEEQEATQGAEPTQLITSFFSHRKKTMPPVNRVGSASSASLNLRDQVASPG